MSSVPPPQVPASWLADWEQTEQEVTAIVNLPVVEVTGHTLVYERQRQFFFASRLAFQPSLPSGVEPVIESTVLAAAKRQLRSRLHDRGAATVTFASDQPATVNGQQMQLVEFDALHEDDTAFDGYLAVLRPDGMRIAGGAYPANDPADGRDTLLGLIAGVE